MIKNSSQDLKNQDHENARKESASTPTPAEHSPKKEYQKPVVSWAKLLGFGLTPTVP